METCWFERPAWSELPAWIEPIRLRRPSAVVEFLAENGDGPGVRLRTAISGE